MATENKAFGVINGIALSVISVLTIFPLYYVFMVSFTDPSEYIRKQGFILFPEQWSMVSYKYILSTSSYLNATEISTFLATVGTLLSLMVTASLAYGLSRKRLKIRKPLMMMILITILFSPGIIPHYILVRDLGLINSVWSLIIPVLSSGWYVFLMKSFFDSIPPSLEEAAMIDGYNDFGVFFGSFCRCRCRRWPPSDCSMQLATGTRTSVLYCISTFRQSGHCRFYCKIY